MSMLLVTMSGAEAEALERDRLAHRAACSAWKREQTPETEAAVRRTEAVLRRWSAFLGTRCLRSGTACVTALPGSSAGAGGEH